MTITEDMKREIQNLHLKAFGKEEGPIIYNMVGEMLEDPTSISISIEKDDKILGNVIFTPFKLHEHPEKKCYLLAPIGVLPEFHGRGLGKDLIEKGVKHLKSINADAVFVLGYPKYYGIRGFYPTYVVLPYQKKVQRIDAWKMRELKTGSMAEVGGRSEASKAIMMPEFWDLNYESNN